MIKHIKPLPISEERLGAYLEGNLSVSDALMVENLINEDKSFCEFVKEISVPDVNIEDPIFDNYPTFELDFELPQIPNTGDVFDGFNDLIPFPLGIEQSIVDDIVVKDDLSHVSMDLLSHNEENDIFSCGGDMFNDNEHFIDINLPFDMDNLLDN